MKLATKLILSFLLISVVSIGLVVGATRLATDREFDSFIDKRYKAEMADELAWYYRENNSFDGVENGFGRFGRRQGMMHGANREPSFFITDPNGIVIVSDGMMHPRGEQIGNEELTKGTEIVVDSQVVGILFVTDPMMRSQIDFAFLRSVYRSIFLSAAGTTLLALIIGVLISRSITRPVSELTHATHKMADGALGEQVPVRSRDEIGDLANSFNKMSADLARSFELRKQMTADIAHELRTPISLILGHAEGVKDGVLKPTSENFEIIRKEAERLERLVSDLRTLSLADAGELSVEFQPVDVNRLMSDVHAHYLTLFNQKRVTLDLQPAPVMLKANLDPNRFAQVLNNILDNALRHTPESGQVQLAVAEKKHNIQISIQDSGEGVNPEEAGHLFDRFFRVDEARARDDGGSGLGLAIAKSIVEMHKGRIWAESEKGRGLKVVIELPAG